MSGNNDCRFLFVSHDYCGTRMYQECFEDAHTGCRFYGYDYTEHGKELATCPRCALYLDQNDVSDITAELPTRPGIPCTNCGEKAPLICTECGLSFCFVCYEKSHLLPPDLPYAVLVGDDDGTLQAA